MMKLESSLQEALKDIDRFKTGTCLDDTTIGLYLESKLADPQRELVEAHLETCLYCLKQLNDMTELLHLYRNPAPVPPALSARLHGMLPQAATTQPDTQPSSLLQRLKDLFDLTPRQWRFSALALASAWMLFLGSTALFQFMKTPSGHPGLNPDSFVKISALNASGKVLREQRGVIVSSDGYIQSDLAPLAGATTIRVTLRDGRTRDIEKVWADDGADLAVMKIDDNNLQGIPMANIASLNIGRKIFVVSDADESAAVSDAIVSDFKQAPGLNNSSLQYIQVSTQKRMKNTGILIDDKGALVGFLITEAEHINFAAPAGAYRHLTTHKATALSEITQSSFSGDALHSYMNGILARDVQHLDEAIGYFTKALQLNPRLFGAHLELGYLYYKKRQFEKEAREYEEVLKVYPDNIDALYGLAWNRESFGRYREATDLYEKALALKPDNTEIVYGLGLSYLAQGNKAKAMKLYVRLKELEPGKAEILRRLMR